MDDRWYYEDLVLKEVLQEVEQLLDDEEPKGVDLGIDPDTFSSKSFVRLHKPKLDTRRKL